VTPPLPGPSSARTRDSWPAPRYAWELGPRALPRPSAWRSWGVNLVLLVSTATSVYLAGGPRLAMGLIAILFAHEMGHFIEAKRQGLNPALPVFIPFLGAYVAIRNARINPWQHALVAIAGPFAGGLAAAAVWVVGEAEGSRLLQALAYFGFMLNLINLAPLWILDGAQITRSIGYLRRGGAPGRALVISIAYGGLAVALALGMFAAHVAQDRL